MILDFHFHQQDDTSLSGGQFRKFDSYKKVKHIRLIVATDDYIEDVTDAVQLLDFLYGQESLG